MIDQQAIRSVPTILVVLVLQAAAFAEPGNSAPFELDREANAVCIRHAGQTRLTYRMSDVPFKPYVKTFLTPGGVNILRDAPHDHLHHHALMFAVAVDGVDFWAEHPQRGPGRQVQRRLETETRRLPGGRSAAAICQQLDWIGSDPAVAPLATERRTIETYAGRGLVCSLLSWRTKLSPAAGKDSVLLTGSHYFGLGMRFVESMDGNGRFVYAASKPGPVVRGEERVTASKWVAYVAAVDGKPVTVAMFDHPSNPRHPGAMFTMPVRFAYISATLDLAKRPLEIAAGRPLLLRYGVALWDGATDRETIESTYAAWLELEAQSGVSAGNSRGTSS